VLVDALATNFNLDVVDQVVTNPVQPTELSSRAIGGLKSDLRQSGLQVHAVNQVTVTLNRARNLLAEVGSTVEGVLNGLHGEVRVTTIYNLKNKVYPSFRNIYEDVVKHFTFIQRFAVTSKGLDYNLSQLHFCRRPITI
jgi:hypothetical protein